MNYTVEKLAKSQIKFSYTVSKDEYNEAVNVVYTRTRGKYSVPGFRKGHAPRKVIEGMYGPYVFFSDAVDHLLDKSLNELENSGEYRIFSVDSVDDVDAKEDGGVSYAVTVTVEPEVKLGEYKGLGIQKKTEEISDADVDEVVKQQQEKQARFVAYDGEAKMGDTVTIDFVGTRDGVAFEGGSGNDYDLELGSGSFIPCFEEQLVGVKAGDVKDVDVTFPENYTAKELAGQPAKFACTVHAVKKKELPALDDEFAKDISEFSTLEEYRADVKAQLVKKAEERAENAYQDAIVDAIVDASEVELPDSMVKREADDMVAEFESRLERQGLKLDQYLTYLNMTREQLLAEYNESAVKRVKVRLVLSAIVEKEDIQISDAEIDAKIEELADANSMTSEEFKKHIDKQYFDYIVNSVMSRKLMDLLKQFNETPLKKPAAKKSAKKPAATEQTETEQAPAADVTAEENAEEKKEAPKKKAPAKKTTKKAEPEDNKAE